MRGRLLRSRLLRRLLETDTSDSCRMPWRERERGEWDQDLNYGTNAIRTFSSPCVCHLHVCVYLMRNRRSTNYEPATHAWRTMSSRARSKPGSKVSSSQSWITKTESAAISRPKRATCQHVTGVLMSC